MSTQHPSTWKLFQRSAERFLALKREHEKACDRMWAGTLASNFTSNELSLLTDYLSEHDHDLLRAVTRAET